MLKSAAWGCADRSRIRHRRPLALGETLPKQRLEKLRDNIRTVFLGHPRAVDLLLIGLLARGHVLIEDVPGRRQNRARPVAGPEHRLQVQPHPAHARPAARRCAGRLDLQHADADSSTSSPGPIFANIVLADEINRTTPRTQSALLEAMSEEQVSVENQTLPLERPFMVVATQNPFEFEGTYYLPENQLDRFLLRIAVGYPERSSEHRILTTQPGRNALDELKPVMTGAGRRRASGPRAEGEARSRRSSITSSTWSKRRDTTNSCTWASRRAAPGADAGGAGVRAC